MGREGTSESEIVSSHYAHIDHANGPAIYTREDMYNEIFRLGGFEELPRDRKSRIGDLIHFRKFYIVLEFISSK